MSFSPDSSEIANSSTADDTELAERICVTPKRLRRRLMVN